MGPRLQVSILSCIKHQLPRIFSIWVDINKFLQLYIQCGHHRWAQRLPMLRVHMDLIGQMDPSSPIVRQHSETHDFTPNLQTLVSMTPQTPVRNHWIVQTGRLIYSRALTTRTVTIVASGRFEARVSVRWIQRRFNKTPVMLKGQTLSR